MIKDCLKRGHKMIRKVKQMLAFIFNKKEEPKENIIFAKRTAQNVPEKHNIQYMKRTPNFEKIMEAVGPEPKNTVSLDDYTVNDILDCVDTIEMFLGWDYEYETEKADYIKKELNNIHKQLYALADYMENNSIEV
jgi:hypothetical protein